MEKKKRVFFISGHRDITNEEFSELYKPAIIKAISLYDALFLIGDYYGVDIMAQNYLVDELNYDIEKITVYHMGAMPMNINKKIINRVPNFSDDIARDSAMTRNSNEDIAFVRIGKEDSGTAQNVLRRVTFINENNQIKKLI